MYRYYLIALILTGIFYSSCGNSQAPVSDRPTIARPETDTTHVKLNIEDQERVEGKDNYGNVLTVPYSVFKIEVKGKPGYKKEIGRFDGRAMRVIAITENGFPDNTIIAYRCFFASQGTDIAITKTDSNLYVMLRKLSDFTRHKENFRAVDTIAVNSDKPVEIK